MPRDDVEAAYFALLRARDEVDALRRYEEYLHAEQQRLRRSRSEAEALRDTVDRRRLRPLRDGQARIEREETDHLATIADEVARLPERLAAAEAFVEECEREHATARGH